MLVPFWIVFGAPLYFGVCGTHATLNPGEENEKGLPCGFHKLTGSEGFNIIESGREAGPANFTESQCSWTFLGAEGCVPVIKCDAFRLGVKNGTGSCHKNYLELSAGPGSGIKFCGSAPVPKFASPSTILVAELKVTKSDSNHDISCTVSCAESEEEVRRVLPVSEPQRAACNCGVPGPGNSDPSAGKVVNGHPAPKGYWRWQAAIIKRRDPADDAAKPHSYSGSSLITDRHLLTAAHCVTVNNLTYIPNKDYVLLNKYDQSSASESRVVQRYIKSITKHPFYRDNPLDYDYTVVELDRPVDITETVREPILRPVCLPPRDSHLTYAGYNATVIGWGRTAEGKPQSPILLEAEVAVISNEDCAKAYPPNWITPRTICTEVPEHRCACRGDSGGPLMIKGGHGRVGRFTQVGVVSWGYCELPGYPDGYARVTAVNDWIRLVASGGVWCEE